jgi:hypothetical protein
MATSKQTVAGWVRSFMCVAAASSVLGLPVAAYFGAEIGLWVAASTTAFAIHATSMAFNRRESALHDLLVSWGEIIPAARSSARELVWRSYPNALACLMGGPTDRRQRVAVALARMV